jgi:hypothetical protein
MEGAVDLYSRAQSCLGGLGGDKGGRLVLSLYFKAVLGVQRIFHFDSLSDVGFAWLTGGPRVLSRNTLGGLIRAASTQGAKKFIKLTQPLLAPARDITMSFDEHTVARFTRKFLIPKGFHTIRNKKMRAEKLFFSFDTTSRMLLDLIVTPGSGRLADVTSQMLAALRDRVRRKRLRVVLDAGAAHSHSEMLKLVDDNPRHVFLVRAPRRKAYLDRWKAFPKAQFHYLNEPGRYKGAPAKRIGITETTTRMRSDSSSQYRQVRTIVVREEKRRGKDRWHALFVFGDNNTAPYQLIQEFRSRQHHEQTYRVLLHDAFVDTVPSGYNKQSSNPNRPGFRKNAITLYAWVTGLAVNTLKTLTGELPDRFRLAHPRTLRRWFLNIRADLYLGNGTLIILMRPRWFRGWWLRKVQRLNKRNIRVPWMDDRRCIYSLGSPPNCGESAEPSIDPPSLAPGVWC